jgi:hypothetical protein
MKIIETNPIYIVSGEGETGAAVLYTGKRTMRAIKMRLNRERCNGDRWSKAKVYSHTSDLGDVFVDVETGDMTF